jgi:hypothetical protein
VYESVGFKERKTKRGVEREEDKQCKGGGERKVERGLEREEERECEEGERKKEGG